MIYTVRKRIDRGIEFSVIRKAQKQFPHAYYIMRTRYLIREYGLRLFFYVVLDFVLDHISILKKKIVKMFYLFFSPMVIRNINGSKMFLDLREKGIHEDLFFDGAREFLLTGILLNSNLIKKGDIVVDIGANIGYYVLIETKLVGKSGKVYAVEPVAGNLRNLMKNVSLNNCDNVEFFQLAIGDINGTSTIYVSDHPNWSSMSKDKTPGKVLHAEIVPMLTLDEFLKDKITPNLIRMDVEGYEYNIIKGMKETLRKNVMILMEFHEFDMTTEQMEEFFEIMKQNNYRIYFSISEMIGITSKIRIYLYKKIFRDDIGFLNLDMESLMKSLIKGKCSNPHVCFIKNR